MSQIEDPLQVVADLKPAALDRLAAEGHARRRTADLARLAAESADRQHAARSGAGSGGRRPPVGSRRARRSIIAAAGASLAATAAAVIIVTTTAPSPAQRSVARSPAASPTASAAILDVHAFLLASAHVAAQVPATTGTYWYVRQRDFAATYSKRLSKTHRDDYQSYYASTEESWTGADRSRTIVSEDLQFNFPTAADKAKWQADGSPALYGPSGQAGDHGPVTNNYNFGGYSTNEADIQVSLASAGKLPTTARKLGALLHDKWEHRSPMNGNPSYQQYLFWWAQALLTGPVQPATRAAVYELLSSQPGFTAVPGLIDPLGRKGTAITANNNDYLIIDPATAQLIDEAYSPVTGNEIPIPFRAGETIPAASNTTAYLSTGWTNTLGVPARS